MMKMWKYQVTDLTIQYCHKSQTCASQRGREWLHTR